MILFGEISLNENQLRWLPLRNSLQSLASFFRGLPRVLGRVKLKGAAIWSSADGTTLYLDGRAFGEPARATNAAVGTALIFPSGNNEGSSDFESWFLLTLPTVVGGFAIVPPNVRLMQRANAFVFTAAGGVRDPIEVVGTISLSAVATADVVIALSVTENRELIEIPANVTVPAGSTSTRFPIGPGRRPADGTAHIPITANAGGAELSATLTIVRG